MMKRALLGTLVALSAISFAADPPPEFRLASSFGDGDSGRVLAPAHFYTLFGQHLGPSGQCIGSADRAAHEPPNPKIKQPNSPPEMDDLVYPKQLCGVQVMIGDQPAMMLYASPTQINFKVPLNTPETANVALRVVNNGQSSAPLDVAVGFQTTKLELEAPAYVGMPVWLKVMYASPVAIQYPYALGPAGFGCNVVEVRRNGVPLPQRQGIDWARHLSVFEGFPCGFQGPAGKPTHLNRLPLHLLYRFDQPGTYEVRFGTVRDPSPGRPGSQVEQFTEWTPIEILPAPAGARDALLNQIRDQAQDDPAELVSDTLPNLLTDADQASFDLLTRYLYHPSLYVRIYAMHGLYYWPVDSTTAAVVALLHSKGPSDVMIDYLRQQRSWSKAQAAEAANASIPFLRSSSPVLIEGAIAAIYAAPNRSELADQVRAAAAHASPLVDANAAGELGAIISEGANQSQGHAVLEQLFEQGNHSILGALLSYKDPNDLAMLGKAMAESHESWVQALPHELYRVYGVAAVPYLEAALRGAPQRFMATALAGELMAAGSPAGFAYAAQAIEKGGVSRVDFLGIARTRFPELQSADDATVIAFLRQRIGGAK